MSQAIALFTSPLPGDEHLDRLREAGLEPSPAPVGDADLSRVRVLLAGLESIDRSDMERYPNLGLIALSSTGCDNVDLDAAAEFGIRVTNIPSQATEEVAGHALALILALLHNLPMHDRNLREGLWESARHVITAPRPSRMTLGIIGVGNIGKSLAHQAQHIFGEIIGFDPFIGPDQAPPGISLRRSAEELIAEADILTVHVPRTPATEQLLGALDLSGSRVRYLINVSRGGLFSHESLLEMLESGGLEGVGLDVFDPEPPGLDPLVLHPRAISTPHQAYVSTQSLEAYEAYPVNNAIAFSTGESLLSPVSA